MLEALGDPFSFYMKPEDFNDSLQGLSGQFEGIGATTASRKADGTEGCTPLGADCGLIVIGTIVDSPAEKAGLLPGDRIAAVDGASVDGQTPDDALKKVRGPKDTVVTLTIVRGTAAPRPVAITRAVIIQPEVIARDLAGGRVGYIGVTGFSDNASAQFIKDLTADVVGRPEGDRARPARQPGRLRHGRPGDRQPVHRVRARSTGREGPTGAPVPSEALAGGVATDPSIKVVVLINANSASASEIVAGALQDTKRAILIGQQSYGKGTVQEFLPLDDDNGGFRLTIARWLTPNQRWINKTGLTPDVVVPTAGGRRARSGAGHDPVLDRGPPGAGLRGCGGRGLGEGRLTSTWTRLHPVHVTARSAPRSANSLHRVQHSGPNDQFLAPRARFGYHGARNGLL